MIVLRDRHAYEKAYGVCSNVRHRKTSRRYKSLDMTCEGGACSTTISSLVC